MEAHMVAQRYSLIGPTMEQPQYNMLERTKVELEYAQIYKTVGLGTTIWSPLASGVLTGKYNEGFPDGTRLGMEGLDWLRDSALVDANLKKVKALTRLALDLSMSMPILALSWCLKNENVSTVILGASKTNQLTENFKALEGKERLTPEVMEQIEKILNNKPPQPMF
jgi:aryl-alcohol dehydrogenase-like predicted oxidoreductase